jgi:molybdopterin-guanine dinucleotide biosynthesis protein B
MSPIPVIGFVASSGSGKTTLLRRVVPLLVARGLRIGYLKHAHHGFDLDVPGKDSYELRASGAAQTLLVSDERWALQAEQAVKGRDPDLGVMLGLFDAGCLDLILVEGFKHARYPKIEVYRPAHGRPPLYPDDPDILAVVTDAPLPAGVAPEVLPLDDPQPVVGFILARCGGPRFGPRCHRARRNSSGWIDAVRKLFKALRTALDEAGD